MKSFRTSDISLSVVAYCREMFQFDLPSVILKKRSEKFESVSFNWHNIELLVKILCTFWFVVSFFTLCFYLWVNKDKHIRAQKVQYSSSTYHFWPPYSEALFICYFWQVDEIKWSVRKNNNPFIMLSEMGKISI